MTESQAIAVRDSKSIASLDELDSILLGGEMNVEIVDDPESVSKQIIAQILAAESDDELANFGSAQGWRELEGVPVEVRGFHWRPSTLINDAGEAGGIYFVVRGVRMDTGAQVTLTTGAMNVLAMLSNYARRGKVPGVVVRLVKAKKPTAAGFTPLMLELVSSPDEAA